MSKTPVRDELLAKLDIKPLKGEAFAALAKRVVAVGDQFPDDKWGTLSPAAQKWINDAIDADASRAPYPPFDAVADAPAADAPAPADAPAADAPAAKASKAPKGAKGAKAAPAAKAPKGAKAAPAAKAPKGAKAAKAAPAAPAEKKPDGRRGNGAARAQALADFPAGSKIKKLVKDNPHKAGSDLHVKWGLLRTGSTVEVAVAAGATRAFLRYFVNHGSISVG